LPPRSYGSDRLFGLPPMLFRHDLIKKKLDLSDISYYIPDKYDSLAGFRVCGATPSLEGKGYMVPPFKYESSEIPRGNQSAAKRTERFMTRKRR